MAVSKQTVMAIKSYQNQAEMLVKNHLLADPVIPYTSIIAGILACKVVYDLTQLFSAMYFKSYAGLNKVQRIEWNNRGISTVHAIFIAAMSLYFVYWSDLYADYQTDGFVTFRNSTLSNFTLGVSVGYFVADLAMILWLYPSLGGMEFLEDMLQLLVGVAAGCIQMERLWVMFLLLYTVEEGWKIGCIRNSSWLGRVTGAVGV